MDMVEAVADINQSLEILLSTSLGERVMLPKYGCNLQDYQFESLNTTMITYLRDGQFAVITPQELAALFK